MPKLTVVGAYELLSLTAGADLQTVDKKFRKLARTCHPDTHPGDKKAEEKFKGYSEARDLINTHFESSLHSSSGPCECRDDIGSGSSESTGRADAPKAKPKGKSSDKTHPTRFSDMDPKDYEVKLPTDEIVNKVINTVGGLFRRKKKG